MRKILIPFFAIFLTSCEPTAPLSGGTVSSEMKRIKTETGNIDYYVVNIDGTDYFVSKNHYGYIIGGKVEKKKDK